MNPGQSILNSPAPEEERLFGLLDSLIRQPVRSLITNRACLFIRCPSSYNQLSFYVCEYIVGIHCRTWLWSLTRWRMRYDTVKSKVFFTPFVSVFFCFSHSLFLFFTPFVSVFFCFSHSLFLFSSVFHTLCFCFLLFFTLCFCFLLFC